MILVLEDFPESLCNWIEISSVTMYVWIASFPTEKAPLENGELF